MKWIAGILAIFLGTFSAKHIECFTQYGTCPDNYFQILQTWTNIPLYLPLPRQEITKTLSQMPEIRAVNIYRRLPTTLVVNLQLRQAVGVVSGKVLGAKIVIDEEGVGYAAMQHADLPLLQLDPGITLGEKITSEQKQALAALAQVQKIFTQKVSGRMEGQTQLVVTVDSRLKVWLDVRKQESAWIYPLQALLARSKMNDKPMRKIDLRFNNPVISY